MKTPQQRAEYNKEYFARPEVIARAKLRNARYRGRRAAYKQTEAGKTAETRYRASEPSVIYQHEYRLKKTYGITEADYQTLLANQAGQCAICADKPTTRLHIDHDHVSGKVRGLLCGRCNRGIGMFKDDISLLKSATRYLKNDINGTLSGS